MAWVIKAEHTTLLEAVELIIPGQSGQLRALQAAVGGYIEGPYYWAHGFEFWVNEDGRTLDLPVNQQVSDAVKYTVRGDVVVTRVGEIV